MFNDTRQTRLHPAGYASGRGTGSCALGQGHWIRSVGQRGTGTDVEVRGKSYELSTTSTGRVGRSHKNRNLAWIGGSAAGGAVIGAIAGGGKGALIGGPVGAGAGTAVAYLTGKKDIRLSAETPLTFKLTRPVTINAKG